MLCGQAQAGVGVANVGCGDDHACEGHIAVTVVEAGDVIGTEGRFCGLKPCCAEGEKQQSDEGPAIKCVPTEGQDAEKRARREDEPLPCGQRSYLADGDSGQPCQAQEEQRHDSPIVAAVRNNSPNLGRNLGQSTR
jgi:hypothetical protein